MTCREETIKALDDGVDNPRRRVSVVDLVAGTKKKIRNEWSKKLIQEIEVMQEDEVIFLGRGEYTHSQVSWVVLYYAGHVKADKVAFTIKTVKGGWKIWRWK